MKANHNSLQLLQTIAGCCKDRQLKNESKSQQIMYCSQLRLQVVVKYQLLKNESKSQLQFGIIRSIVAVVVKDRC